MPGRRRGSATTPAIALAAAVNGEARKVRPPLPWRPSKLRLLVLTAYWPGPQLVAVHRDAHRAAGLAPFGAGRLEDLGQALGLGFALHLVRARDDHQADAVRDVAVLEHAGGQPQVADPAVGAAPHEDDVDLLAEDRLTGLEVHVLERPLEGAPLARVGLVGGGGDPAGDRDAHPGVGAVGDHRLERVGIDGDGLVVGRAVVGRERAPGLDRGVPGRPDRGVGAAVEVLEGRVVRGDQPGPRAALDAHVADGHPLFHRQSADRLAGVLEDVPGPAADPDPGDQREDDVLGTHPGDQPAVDTDLVGLRVALEERLGGQHHLDLAGPDPERQRAERAVGRGVRVAAHDGHPRLGQSELRSDDVDDALSRIADAVERDPELGAIGLELIDLGERHLVDERQAPVGRRDRVVRGRDGLAGPADADPARAQPGECLRAGHLVDEVEVDGQHRGRTRVLGHHMVCPDLVDDGAGRGSGHLASVPEAPREGPEHGRSGPKAARSRSNVTPGSMP